MPNRRGTDSKEELWTVVQQVWAELALSVEKEEQWDRTKNSQQLR